ncbi:MAG TPA: peptide deformylase [Blastocatellia bacterium]|nr:peptide deformylase [Blastocatellia bacterium]
MATREILVLGNPVLWEKCAPVQDYSDSGTRALVRDLSDTLASFREANGFGRGIAAPQLGTSKRVIFIRMRPSGFAGPLINPEVVSCSPDQIELWDDCFSIPNLMVRVRRSAQVRVRFTDERGAEQHVDAEGDLSELLQHEIDHLDGILTVERAVSPNAFAVRSEWSRRYRDR